MRSGRGILPAVGALALIAALVIAFKVWDENHSRQVIIQNSGSQALFIIRSTGGSLDLHAQPGSSWTIDPGQQVSIDRRKGDMIVAVDSTLHVLPRAVPITWDMDVVGVRLNGDGSITLTPPIKKLSRDSRHD